MRDTERGVALVWVTICALLLAGVVFSSTTRMRAHEQAAEVGFTVDGQAYSVARAGLVDALAWMRRRPNQPVLEFQPELDLDAPVPVDDTDDPRLGLVRTFEISPGLWGRYVVRRGRPMDPFTDLNGNGLYDDGEPFIDLTFTDVWPDVTLDDTFPPAFNEAAAPIVADYRADMDALAVSYGGDLSSTRYEQEADALRKAYERRLIDLAQGFPTIAPGQAKKVLDAAPVQVVEEAAGTNDGEWTDAQWTRDVAAERGQPGAGTVWRIESRGTVYRLSDGDLPLGSGPNRILGTCHLATEVRRLGISPPASAAICAPRSRRVTVGLRSRIRSEELAVAAGDTKWGLDLHGGQIDAPTWVSSVPEYDDDVRAIFGVDWAQLRSMADVSTVAERTALYRDVNPYTLVTIAGDVAFSASLPLRGKGVLAVDGNVTIDPASKSFFTGVLYVDGDLVVRAPAYLQGVIICTGDVDLEGSGADYVDVEHEPGIIGNLLSVMGQYRITRAVYGPDARLEGWSLRGGTELPASPHMPATPADPWSNFWNDGGASADPTPSSPTEPADWWLTR